MITRKSNNPEIVVEVNWTDYEEHEYLSSIPVKVQQREPLHFTGNKTGTKIEISNLRNTWNRGMIRELARSVNSINSPFDEQGNIKTGGLQFFDDFGVSAAPGCLKLGQQPVQRQVVEIDKIAQNMITAVRTDSEDGSGAYFNAGYELERWGNTLSQGFPGTVNGIVVCYGNGLQLKVHCHGYNFPGCECPVRSGGVDMKIYPCLSARVQGLFRRLLLWFYSQYTAL